MRDVVVAIAVVLVGIRIVAADPGDAAERIASAARRAGRCPSALGAAVFRCSVKAEDGSEFGDCYRFSSGGVVSSKFDLLSDRLGITVGCACKPGGSPKKPSFALSSEFSCTTDLGVAFQGRLTKNGITKGAVTNAQGGSFAFTCTRDDGCTL
jgi:hypothetical protein